MKSTGVVRRIDELGRIVIPKEIRKNMGLREGESLEIYVDDNKLIMQKYSKINNYQDNIKNIIQFISDSFSININFYDRDKLVYNTNDIFGKLSFIKEFNEIIINRKEEIIDINIEGIIYKIYCKPIIISSDVIGILVYEIKNNLEEIVKVSNFLNQIIIKKIDIS